MQEEYDTLDHRGYYALFLCSDNVFFNVIATSLAMPW